MAAGDFLRAGEIGRGQAVDLPEWTLCVLDQAGQVRIPKGSMGSRWGKTEGHWNLDMVDLVDGEPIDSRLTQIGGKSCMVRFTFEGCGNVLREVPVSRVVTASGEEELVVTVFDLLAAQLGVSRGLGGDYPQDYKDDKPFTPAWQEKYTGISPETVLQIAREWGENGEKTQGRNMIIVGAGINHWYHNDLIYRAAITALILTGSVGKQGAG